jgi:hypothetical protein
VLNNPIRYTDPTGHFTESAINQYVRDYCNYERACNQLVLNQWQSDAVWWGMLRDAEAGDVLYGHVDNYLGNTAYTATFGGNSNTLLTGVMVNGTGTGVPETMTLLNIQASFHQSGTKGLDLTKSIVSWGGFYRPNESGAPTYWKTKNGYEMVDLGAPSKSGEGPITEISIGLAFAYGCKGGGVYGIAGCFALGALGSPIIMDALDVQSIDYQFESGPYYFNFQTQPNIYNTWECLKERAKEPFTTENTEFTEISKGFLRVLCALCG